MTQYKLVVDCSTGKQEYIALTPAEIAEKDQMAAEAAEYEAKRKNAIEAQTALKASAKAKLTAGEPLTEEEAAAIVL